MPVCQRNYMLILRHQLRLIIPLYHLYALHYYIILGNPSAKDTLAQSTVIDVLWW